MLTYLLIDGKQINKTYLCHIFCFGFKGAVLCPDTKDIDNRPIFLFIGENPSIFHTYVMGAFLQDSVINVCEKTMLILFIIR